MSMQIPAVRDDDDGTLTTPLCSIVIGRCSAMYWSAIVKTTGWEFVNDFMAPGREFPSQSNKRQVTNSFLRMLWMSNVALSPIGSLRFPVSFH